MQPSSRVAAPMIESSHDPRFADTKEGGYQASLHTAVYPNAPSPQGSEGRSGGVGTYPAIGRIERFNAPHIVVIKTEPERPDVLLQPFEAHRFRNNNQT